MHPVHKIEELMEKLNNEEKKCLILGLLMKRIIQFEDITSLYVDYLKMLDNKNESEKRLIAHCLASKYNEGDDMEYLNARSSILLEPYVPDEFIKSNVLQGASKKAIKKEKDFLDEELKLKKIDHRWEVN